MEKCIGTISTMWQDSTYKTFTDDLAKLCIYSQKALCKDDEYINYQTAQVSYHALGRKQIVDNFTGDWLLMLDTDHAFSPDLLERMLRLQKKYNTPVLSGVYCYKYPPHGPVVNMYDEEGEIKPLVDWDRNEDVIQVDLIGAGCLLVQKEVFTKIKRELKEDPFDIRPGFSEDFSFCNRCKELNIPIYLAPKVECHHIVRHILSINDYIPPVSV